MRKYLTLDDLLLFCKKNNFNHFNAKDSDGPIVVQTPGKFELNGDSNAGLQPVKLSACHTSLNRNGSSISKDAMEAALPSFSNRPILGYIHQLEDGTWDFYSHNIEVVEDENEKDGARIDYLETPVGIIPESCNAHLEYDEESDVYRTCVNGFIFEEYSKAGDILRTKGISNVSVELAINDMSYNSDDGYLSINDFYFMGVTILGCDEDGNIVEPGMAGSNITLGSFSAENNSMLNNDINNTLIATLNRLAESLEKFNNITDFNEEGGEKNTMNKFEELLELYSLEESEIEFEVKGLSDEELEAKFTEIYGDAEEFKKKKRCSDENDEEEDESEEDEDFAGCGKKKKRCSINKEAGIIEFELSHDDIRMALYGLLKSDNDDNSYLWICEVYDSYFIYQKEIYYDADYEYKYYKQGYSRNGDEIELSGDEIEVFSTFVTESEKAALETMRSQYDELKAFKDECDAKLLKDQKNEVFAREEYAAIADTDEFKTLVSDMDKYSVEEIEVKCDLLFAAHVKAIGEFSAKQNGEKPMAMRFSVKSVDEANKKPYGNLFD